MFSDRFLIFLVVSGIRLGRVEGRSAPSVSGGILCRGALGAVSDGDFIMMVRNGETGAFDKADSGDDEGEESAIKGESKVEFVFVGDDSVEVEVMEVTLSRWYREIAECCLMESDGGSASVTRIWESLSGIEWGIAAKSSMSFRILASVFPTTDMNNGSGIDMADPTSTGCIFEYLVG